MDASETNMINRSYIPDFIVDKYKEENFFDMDKGINKITQESYV